MRVSIGECAFATPMSTTTPPNLRQKIRIKNGESTGALQSICLLKDMFGKATAAQVYSRSTPAVCPDFLGALRAFVLWIPCLRTD